MFPECGCKTNYSRLTHSTIDHPSTIIHYQSSCRPIRQSLPPSHSPSLPLSPSSSLGLSLPSLVRYPPPCRCVSLSASTPLPHVIADMSQSSRTAFSPFTRAASVMPPSLPLATPHHPHRNHCAGVINMTPSVFAPTPPTAAIAASPSPAGMPSSSAPAPTPSAIPVASLPNLHRPHRRHPSPFLPSPPPSHVPSQPITAAAVLAALAHDHTGESMACEQEDEEDEEQHDNAADEDVDDEDRSYYLCPRVRTRTAPIPIPGATPPASHAGGLSLDARTVLDAPSFVGSATRRRFLSMGAAHPFVVPAPPHLPPGRPDDPFARALRNGIAAFDERVFY